jgi:hypothetical protein
MNPPLLAVNAGEALSRTGLHRPCFYLFFIAEGQHDDVHHDGRDFRP